MITITGTVGNSGKYLVTGIPVDTEIHTVLKLPSRTTRPGPISAYLRERTRSLLQELADCNYRTPAVQDSNS
jgi:hypothetical protein